MSPITLSRFLIEEERNKQAIGADLRFLVEVVSRAGKANPNAMIVEQAGGLATTGRERILDIRPTALHQRVPVILGSKHEVERVAGYHAA